MPGLNQFHPLVRLDKLDMTLFRVLTREIKSLDALSKDGKLKPAQARDLVAYLKLVPELREEHKALTAEKADATSKSKAILTDEQLLQEALKTNK